MSQLIYFFSPVSQVRGLLALDWTSPLVCSAGAIYRNRGPYKAKPSTCVGGGMGLSRGFCEDGTCGARKTSIYGLVF